MTTAIFLRRIERSAFPLFVAGVIALVCVRAARAWPTIWAHFLGGDNDDLMRLLSVRAWLEGQSWFDMTQYRVLPPEGVSMHWSRYVDAGTAAILVPLSHLVPMEQAERLTILIWPNLLLALLATMTGRGLWQLFGPAAAVFATIQLFLWPPVSGVAFVPGRIDHHNIQILLITTVALAMVLPGNSLRRGLVAGAAAAGSLTVGLEMMPFLIAAWTMLAVRFAFFCGDARRVLAGFACAIAVCAPLLMAGQIAPVAWLTPHCDAIGTPVLALVFTGAAASLIPLAMGGRLAHPLARLGVMAAIAAVGLAASMPLLRGCLDGPYAGLPPDVLNMLHSQISEAMPGLEFASSRPADYSAMMTPVAVALFGSAIVWFRSRAQMAPVQRDAVGQMLILCAVGFLGTFSQIRMILMTAATAPFLTGFLLSWLMKKRQADPGTLYSLLMIATAAATLFAGILSAPAVNGARLILGQSGTDHIAGLGWQDDACRNAGSLGELNALPPSRILTRLNLGTPLMLETWHYALTAPYHRSRDAFWNGIFPFEAEAAMKTALLATGADYVVLCQKPGSGTPAGYSAQLMAGNLPRWLHPVALPGRSFLVLAVDRAALGQMP